MIPISRLAFRNARIEGGRTMTMLKVIIADDEEKVCNLIYKLIDWQALDMEVAGMAHNGIEALALVKRLNVDLIITDIRMPGYDGLQLISRIKQINNDIDFIIISGYSNFEYAQNAIKFGVSDYLLKPIKKTELLGTLTKMSLKYRKRMELLSDQEHLKNRLQSDIGKLRSGLFTEVFMQKNPSGKELTVGKVNESFHYHFQKGCFQIVILKMDCGCGEGNHSSLRLMEDKIIQAFQHSMEDLCFDYEYYVDDTITYYVLNYSEENKKIIRKHFKWILDDLLIQKSVFGAIEITIGAGRAEEEIGRQKASFLSAQYAIAERLMIGTGRLIEGVTAADAREISGRILSDLNKSMGAALEILDKEGVLSSVQSFEASLKGALKISGYDAYRLCLEACNIYLTLIRVNRYDIGNPEELSDNFCFHARRCSSIGEILEYLAILIEKSLDKISEDKRLKDTKPIRMAKQYIQEHYSRQITLEEVSSFAGFSPSYFSTLFKKESGINFQEYLSEVRMKKAKDLLKETNLTIAGICEQVGYSDLKHFTKNFKRIAGIKPNEYRKLYS